MSAHADTIPAAPLPDGPLHMRVPSGAAKPHTPPSENSLQRAPRTDSPLLGAAPHDGAKAQTRGGHYEPELTLSIKISSFIGILVVYVWSCVFEWIGNLFKKPDPALEGYAPLVKDFDDFYRRHFYNRIGDCFRRPIDSRPSRVIGIMERETHDGGNSFEFTGKIVPAINLSSYNYLGFAEDTPSITTSVIDSIDASGIASCSTPQELGQSGEIAALEREFAAFVGKEDAIACGMGYATNFCGLPGLFSKDTLVLSDSLNHNSLINGVRSSGAKVKAFRHDRYDEVEAILREAVVLGQNPAGDYVPWKRVVIVIEGIYSMEGEICDLPRYVELKKKYKALLFVDEAHSIGALGKSGRGVCEYHGVDPRDVDVLMGTFTKSFGSIGGYIASDRALISYLRTHSTIGLECDTLAPPCSQQALSVLRVLLGKDGTDLGRKRIAQLQENSRFLRRGLVDLGFGVLGDDDSPVIPVMVYTLSKLPHISRRFLEHNIAIVVVGYPATPLLLSRIRFCVSACHTREDLQHTLDMMRLIANDVNMQYCPENIKA